MMQSEALSSEAGLDRRSGRGIVSAVRSKTGSVVAREWHGDGDAAGPCLLVLVLMREVLVFVVVGVGRRRDDA